MISNPPPKFQNQPLSADKQEKLILSFEECTELEERTLNCPYCGFPIDGIFSDAVGHLRVKCHKCKAVMVLSLAYFRRQRRYPFTTANQKIKK